MTKCHLRHVAQARSQDAMQKEHCKTGKGRSKHCSPPAPTPPARRPQRDQAILQFTHAGSWSCYGRRKDLHEAVGSEIWKIYNTYSHFSFSSRR